MPQTTTHSSHKVQEIIARPPKLIERIGIYAVLGFVVCLVIGMWLIERPETVQGRIKISTPQPPLSIYAQNDGKIIAVFKQEGEFVDSLDVLMEIESSVSKDAFQ